ncbi:hypothetical protein CRYUN_Cryun29cG0048100 [Craigia yunnanensis]
MAMASEEDKGFEAVLLGFRNRMRRRSWCHRLLRHAGHELRQHSVGGPAVPKRPPRIPLWEIMTSSSFVNQMMGKVNQERLAEYLGELQRKEDTNDRYVAALRGETLTRNPYQRIQPIPKQKPEVDSQQKKTDKA